MILSYKLLVSMCPKESKSAFSRDGHTPEFTVALFRKAVSYNQFRYPSIDEWIQKYGIYIP
jgi:hypothetical protein